MQLSKIKISGFKSFVDPTNLVLPSRLVAIVGPNGCGKSNIIDAVTWVMGESSPKYLRGESLTDVIFNGSSARKPIGQASVELIFDNSDGTIGGEYSKFAEISVKRVINRESDSQYFLNGVRCRKRDVVDIFLGTGLGPRSYSIIGQNMISRVIEAKPDDLRTYLEEAAGISKYKERRHETELRINHTKENLSRVNDVCLELDKQLAHLKHQANVAEKFKTLKAQERVLRAELFTIQWRELDSKMVDYTLQIQREETALEAKHSDMTGIDRDLEHIRNEQRSKNDAFQEVQRRFYAVGNDITRFEQDILHHQERREQWERDLRQSESDWQSVQTQLEEAQDHEKELDADIFSLEPTLKTAKEETSAKKQHLTSAENALHDLQSRWDEFNQASAKTTQEAQVEKTRIDHLEQQIAILQKRQDQLQHDENQFNFSQLDKELEDISEKSEVALHEQQQAEAALGEVRTKLTEFNALQTTSNKELDALRNELQKLRGQQASLEALQQTALGQRDNPAANWIVRHDLDKNPRLAQEIMVEKGWELAAEKVLGFSLQGICIDDLRDVLPKLNDFNNGNLCLYTNENKQSVAKNKKATLLAEKIQSPFNLNSLLYGIYIADSLDDALALCDTLEAHESIITKEGVWLNQSWIKILRLEDPAAGVFEREQELKKLSTRIAELETRQAELEVQAENVIEQIKRLEKERDEKQQAVNAAQAKAAQCTVQQKVKQERLSELRSQYERFKRDQEECVRNLAKAQTDVQTAKQNRDNALTALDNQVVDREQLISDREQARQQVQSAREETNVASERMHELEIRLQTALSQKTALQQTIARLQTQLTHLNERKTTLQNELNNMASVENIKQSLAQALEKHAAVEAELKVARDAVETMDQEFRNLESQRAVIEKEISKIRTTLEKLRVEWQGWKVKADTILEQLKETEFALETVLKELTPEANASEWQTKVEQVVNRINRLGPINLVAIEEYATCAERKQYLDQQLADLQAGLQTLEDAIAKIDKETKARFKETFDKVNDRFQELFPTIFGGGKAYLELNSDDLLTAGVTMMACPPGKRNSSIYLLSGGEKSLTAIALIFSIFHLNPAPFCLLDEVDAALDDANVLRFTRLVKVMADKTQFLFISHNKVTIEMGEHLIGVTMNEPGVSRLVSVDIEKAMSLVGT